MRRHLLGATALIALGAPPGFAQDAAGGTAAPGSAKPAPRVEEIVVTAQRRSEKLQSVPVAVSSYSSRRRDRLGIETIQDFANFTPGLSYSTSLDRISLRGVGRLTNLNGSDPGVATYNDGFYTSSTVEASKTPMFVDRVEFLRGPQGTLYGRNSVGGAINIYSKRPTDSFTAEVRSSIDNYGGAIAEGYVSGPLVGGLKARISLQLGPHGISDTFKNIGTAGGEGEQDKWLGEVQLQYDFSDRDQIWLKYSHARWDDTFRSGNFTGQYATTTFFPAKTIVPNPAWNYNVPNPGASDPRTINTDTQSSDHLVGNHTFVINAKAGLGSADLKYVSGYQTYRYTQFNDLDNLSRGTVVTNYGTKLGDYSFDPSYAQRYMDDKQYYSNELTLSNHEPGRLNYIAGLYQYHENYLQTVNWYLAGPGNDDMSRAFLNPINLFTGKPAQANPSKSFYAGSGNLTTNSYAAFGQMDYQIMARVKITAGMRYSQDEKTGDETFRLVYWNPTQFVAACGGGCGPFTPAVDVTSTVAGAGDGSGTLARTSSGTWRGLTGRLAIDYLSEHGDLYYASYSRGLKSGGFNLGAYSKGSEVDKETLDAFEIGTKMRPAPDLIVNLAGFFYLYDNAQVPLFVNEGGVSVQNFFNIPQSQSKGVELETVWYATKWLELSGTYAFTDARITKTNTLYVDDNSPSSAPVSINGDRLPQTAEHQVAVSALADIPIDYGSLYFATSFIYRSPVYYGVFTTPNYHAPGWNQVDLRLTWVNPARKLTLIGFVRNLFDSFGYDGVTPGNGASAVGFDKSYSFTPPRTIGAEIQYKF